MIFRTEQRSGGASVHAEREKTTLTQGSVTDLRDGTVYELDWRTKAYRTGDSIVIEDDRRDIRTVIPFDHARTSGKR